MKIEYNTSLYKIKFIKMAKRQIIYDINQDDIVFEKYKPTFSSSKPNISKNSNRINIKYNQNGETVPLILAPKGCKFYSFGIQENIYNGINTGNYNICLCINTDNTKNNSKEEEFCMNIYKIFEKCKTYLQNNKRENGIKYDDFISCPLKISENEDNKTVNTKIYLKLIYNKDQDKVWTDFYNIKGEILDYQCIKNKHCLIYPAILFDSVYITGGKAYIQCKLSEAIVSDILASKTPSLNIEMLSE